MKEISLLRAKINLLDIKRREYVNEMISLATEYSEKTDLWLEYANKRTIPHFAEETIGKPLFDFFISLIERNDERLKENTELHAEDMLKLIYEECIIVESETELSEKGISLVNELLDKNIGILYLVW